MTTCQACKGSGMLEMKCRNLGTCTDEWHIVGCPYCEDKGYITDEDRERIHNRMMPILNDYRPYGQTVV